MNGAGTYTMSIKPELDQAAIDAVKEQLRDVVKQVIDEGLPTVPILDATVLQLQPGDTLVVRMPLVGMDVVTRTAERIKAIVGADVKVMVVPPDVGVEVLRREDAS